MFTTADPEILESVLTESLDGAGAADHSTSPLAGLGYGIPISRNYARFRRDLVIMSMEVMEQIPSYIFKNWWEKKRVTQCLVYLP